MPGSSSLIHTPAVMCIAETSAMPSLIPDSSTARRTSSVMRTNARRCSTWNVLYTVCDFTLPPCSPDESLPQANDAPRGPRRRGRTEQPCSFLHDLGHYRSGTAARPPLRRGPRHDRDGPPPRGARRKDGDGMTRIAFIGAGSVEFTRNLLGDIFSFPELAGADERDPGHAVAILSSGAAGRRPVPVMPGAAPRGARR